MSDLIERLRACGPVQATGNPSRWLCEEAADALAARDSVIAEKERELAVLKERDEIWWPKVLEQAESKLAQAMADAGRLFSTLDILSSAISEHVIVTSVELDNALGHTDLLLGDLADKYAARGVASGRGSGT